MNPPSPEDFPAFFEAIHGYKPFSWQRRLAERAAAGDWPEVLDLPTASGKTACIDIAVFALACQADQPALERSAPRRIAFVVDRRVIVAAARKRARKIACRLQAGEDSWGQSSDVLARVAEALHRVGGLEPGEPPLMSYELRGGVYRDPSWARSIARPTVIATTVDQIGSRLLFRGYGVSDSSRPIHAALAGNDVLILLDEAHCAVQFLQTARAVADYRRLVAPGTPEPPPFRVAVLSATPPSKLRDSRSHPEVEPFGLDQEDRSPEQLGPRLEASKPATLVEPVATPKVEPEATAKFAEALAKHARALAGTDAPKAVAIFVNRVATARAVFKVLSSGRDSGKAYVILMIGRMRPIDRDKLVNKWEKHLQSGAKRSELERNVFVVATQCLEVGADFDFDAIVTECASLDALRQRFGRLNRMGRPIEAKAAILVRSDQAKEGAKPDPIYGESLAKTWRWLREKASDEGGGPFVDFGINALGRLLDDNLDAREDLRVSPVDAPVMLPAHIDCWVQTAPSPDPDPDPALFLHGPGRSRPEIKVCWRADLEMGDEPNRENRWIDAVSLCPPVAAECMTVPLPLAKNWLDGAVVADESGDLEESVPEADQEPSQGKAKEVLRWAGPDDERTKLINVGADLRPGDTLVIPAEVLGWETLGHIPRPDKPTARDSEESELPITSIDVAEQAYLLAGRRAVLRLNRKLMAVWPAGEGRDKLERIAFESENPTEEQSELRDALRELAEAPMSNGWEWLALIARTLADESPRRRRIEFYDEPDEGLEDDPRGNTRNQECRVGLVLLGSTRLNPAAGFEESTTEDDTASTSTSPIALDDHCLEVEAEVRRLANLFDLPEAWKLALTTSARWHDFGKSDRRFQGWLHGGDLRKADQAPQLLAKSRISCSKSRRERDRERSGFPKGGRHELLSVRIAETNRANISPSVDFDLILHLIESHHGQARPFLPFAEDLELGYQFPDDPAHRRQLDCLVLPSDGVTPSLEPWSTDPNSPPLHRIDGGPPRRFWALIRRHGWWGLAWLESILRLADQTVSEREQNRKDEAS